MRNSRQGPAVNADVIVAGGGPAGLSCALVLARCRRKVIVIDSGNQRNLPSAATHGFLTRDGCPPQKILALAQQELRHYGVIVYDAEITRVEIINGGFLCRVSNGKKYKARKLVLATGIQDKIPAIPRIMEFYGKSVFHCPYCDGYELRDKPWAVYSPSRKAAVADCLKFLTWTRDVMLLADHVSHLRASDIAGLQRNGIKLVRGLLTGLAGRHGKLKYLVIDGKERIPCSALFFSNGYNQQSALGAYIGCTMSKQGKLIFNRYQMTNIPGIYAAGDAAHDMNLIVIAAAEGAKAAVAIDLELSREDIR